MQLTEEQRQLVEAAGGQPVQFIDPCSMRRYVLVPEELYYRPDPKLMATDAPPSASPPEVACGKPSALPPEVARGEPLRIKLRELPMPPELAERVRRYCKRSGIWRRKYVQGIEDDAKMSYFFGGQTVVTISSKDGPIIVAAGREASEAFGRQLDALPPEERRPVSYWFPPPWDGPASEPRILFTHEDSTSPG